MAVLSFSHPGICVSDLERSTRFYVDVLGFAELFTMDFTADELAATMERPGAFSSRMLRRRSPVTAAAGRWTAAG
jgi:glyoxylase I family protein